MEGAMLPDHCKDVSVRDVEFPLTPENIAKEIKGKKAYTRTSHIILRRGNEAAVVRVEKKAGPELFRPIIGYDILSLPEDTVIVKHDGVDVLSPSQMALVSRTHPGKMVIVQGLFAHVSFVKDLQGNDLHVLDVVPPSPSKLSVLVERALLCGAIDLPIVPVVEDIDLNELEKRVGTRGVVFPCRASGITSGKEVHFLDETPTLEGDVTLIGCDLSRRIYESVYRRRPSWINMCPQDIAPKDQNYRIVKCCRVREGFELKGRTAIVPWGATVPEVVAAIKALFASAEAR
jgi:hypothetical protein